MSSGDKAYLKRYLYSLGYKQSDTEVMLNNLHEGEWWSHTWQSDEDYETY